jgi:peptidyl-prolyl cis-trans isomerase D
VTEAAFQTAKDSAAMAEGASSAEWVVFQVTDITVPEVSADAENKRVTDNMRRTMSEDVLAQYVQRLQTDIGATINFDVVRRVASGSTDQN